MKKLLFLLVFALSFSLLNNESATAQVRRVQTLQKKEQTTLPPPLTSAPYIFSASTVATARATVTRAGWTDVVIDSQMPEDGNPGQKAWKAAVKAALFGGEERFQAALQALNFNSSVLQASSTSWDYIQSAGDIVRSYDCLQALPEWNQADPINLKSLEENLNRIFQVVNSNYNDQNSSLRIQRQAGLLCAKSLIASPTVAETTQEQDPITGLREALYSGLNGEGLLADASFRQHLQVMRDVLTAAAILKAASPASFVTMQQWFKGPVDLVAELSYPDGQIPGLDSEGVAAYETAMLLEQGYSLFADPKYAFILNRIYQRMARPGEALLWNTIELKSGKADEFNTRAFPQTGAAMLYSRDEDAPILKRSPALSVFLNSGLTTQGNAAPLLGMNIMNASGTISSSLPLYDTAGMNTVVVNCALHEPYHPEAQGARNALIESIKPFQNGSVYLSASAAGQMTGRKPYSDAIPLLNYQRTLFVDTPLVVDFFRVRGGTVHDYIYHGSGRIVPATDEQWNPYSLAVEEMNMLFHSVEPPVASNRQGVYSFQFTPKEGLNVSERLWFVDPAGSQVIVGSATDHSYIVARREHSDDTSNLYAVVHEVVHRRQEPISKVERIALTPAGNERDFQAAGIAVTRGGRVDIYLSSTQLDTVFTGDFNGGKLVFEGTFGHIQLQDGEFRTIQLVGGKQLRYDANGVEMKVPADYGIVRGIDASQGELNIDFLNPLPSGEALHGLSFLHMSQDEHPVMIQPLLVKSIQPDTAPQTLSVQNYPSFLNPHPSLGSPVRVGDSLILEPHIELLYNPDNNYITHDYRVLSSVPATVMVDGGEKYNRVMFAGSILKRVRGESKAGVITFEVQPEEFRGGMVQFSRMP